MYLLGDVPVQERSDWGARPPRSITRSGASYGLTVHWEGPGMGAFPHSSCATKVRGIQNFHMDSRGWSDAAYNWIVCPHGVLYELRGSGVKTAANGTSVGNASARAVCGLWGEGDAVTDKAKHAIAVLRGFLHGIVRDCGPSVNCHQDWKPTACPGGICAWVHAGAVDPLPAGPAPQPPPPAPAPHPPVATTGDAMFSTCVLPDGGLCEAMVGTDSSVFFRTAPGLPQLMHARPLPLGGLAKSVACYIHNSRLVIAAHGLDDRIYYNVLQADLSWTGWMAGTNHQLHP